MTSTKHCKCAKSYKVPVKSDCADRNGVELLINTKVESINADELTLKGKEGSRTVPYGACVWATGVSMHPLTAHLQQQMPEGTQAHNRLVFNN